MIEVKYCRGKMSTEWKKHNFELIQTADGSPSLVVSFGENSAECMHHRGGAWAETKMIYAQPAKVILQQGGRRFLSVGLGLAYNEMMLMALSQELALSLECIQSYEAEPFLIECFQNFIQGQGLHPELHATYQNILNLIATGHDALQLQKFMKECLHQDKLRLFGALNSTTLPRESFDYVLFDAFSNKSNPELWTEDFLTQFFSSLGHDCVVSTYACTGALKRSLKKTGFELLPRSGFAGRRESTLAVKGQKYRGALATLLSEIS